MSKNLKQEIFDFVQADFEAVEKALQDNLNPYLDLVRQVSNHIMFAGGKRLRPILMILCARLCGCRNKGEIRLSTVFEYLHTASLLHDDIVDSAQTRRGKPVAHTLWDPSKVVLVGDFLLARTCSIATDTEKLPIIKVITDVTGIMSEGELQQLENIQNVNLDEAQYMDTIHRKTAALISAACQVGGLLAGATEEKTQALADYGKSIGIAFQMADDLLDYTADPEVSGKAVGKDLAEGKLTLPLIYALEKADEKTKSRLEKIIQTQSSSKEDFAFALEAVTRLGGLDYTRRMAEEHVAAAKKNLELFEDCPEKEILNKIADFSAGRES